MLFASYPSVLQSRQTKEGKIRYATFDGGVNGFPAGRVRP